MARRKAAVGIFGDVSMPSGADEMQEARDGDGADSWSSAGSGDVAVVLVVPHDPDCVDRAAFPDCAADGSALSSSPAASARNTVTMESWICSLEIRELAW